MAEFHIINTIILYIIIKCQNNNKILELFKKKHTRQYVINNEVNIIVGKLKEDSIQNYQNLKYTNILPKFLLSFSIR